MSSEEETSHRLGTVQQSAKPGLVTPNCYDKCHVSLGGGTKKQGDGEKNLATKWRERKNARTSDQSVKTSRVCKWEPNGSQTLAHHKHLDRRVEALVHQVCNPRREHVGALMRAPTGRVSDIELSSHLQN